VTIYKICHLSDWNAAESAGSYAGSAKDVDDGFMHFSTGAQLHDTLRKHYAGATDLVLVAVNELLLGAALKYEPSRDGALFPHLYGPLPMSAVTWSMPIVLNDGEFVLPAGVDSAAR